MFTYDHNGNKVPVETYKRLSSTENPDQDPDPDQNAEADSESTKNRNIWIGVGVAVAVIVVVMLFMWYLRSRKDNLSMRSRLPTSQLPLSLDGVGQSFGFKFF